MYKYKSTLTLFTLLLLSSFAFAQKPAAHFTCDCKILCLGAGVGQIGDDKVGFKYDGTSPGTTTFAWTFQGATPSTSTDKNPTSITYSAKGTYLATVTATNGSGSSSFTDTIYVLDTCKADFIISSGNTICDTSCVNFRDASNFRPDGWSWIFDNGSGLPQSAFEQNPTNICYLQPGTYLVKLTSSRTNTACFNQAQVSRPITVMDCGIFNAVETINFNKQLSIYPNPSKNLLTVSGDLLTGSTIEVSNVLGSRIINQKAIDKENTIDISKLTPGVYFLSVKYGDGSSKVRKFVKE